VIIYFWESWASQAVLGFIHARLGVYAALTKVEGLIMDSKNIFCKIIPSHEVHSVLLTDVGVLWRQSERKQEYYARWKLNHRRVNEFLHHHDFECGYGMSDEDSQQELDADVDENSIRHCTDNAYVDDDHATTLLETPKGI
jgi:hypothetical protein